MLLSGITAGITMDKRQLLALCVCFVLITLQGTITVSLLPVYAMQLGADPTSTGLFVAFAFLAVTLGNITGGWLSDQIGKRKPMLLISCAVWIPLVLLMTQATDIRGLILTTGLCWFPGGIALAMVNIITGLSTVEGDRGKVFGWTALASGIGGLLAGTIGGPIAERWGFPVLFVVMAATITLLLAIAIYIQDKPIQLDVSIQRTKGSAPTEERQGVGFLLILLLVAHLLVRLAQLIGGLGSPLAMTRLGFNAADVSSAIAVSAAVTLPLPLLLGWLSDKAGRKRFLVLCYGTGALGLLVMIPAAWLWQFWLSASLIAISNAANGVAQAFVADLVPPQAMGRGMSLFNTVSLLAGIVGLGGAGYVMQTIGIGPTLLLGACLPLVAIGLLLRLHKPTFDPKSLSTALPEVA